MIKRLAAIILLAFQTTVAPNTTVIPTTTVAAGTFTWSHRAGQSGYNATASSVTTLAVTLSANPTTSDLVVCGFAFASGIGSFAFADSVPNSYTITPGSPHYGIVKNYVAYLLSAPSGATKVLTATWTTGSAALINCDEFIDSTPGHQTYDSTAGDAFKGTGTGSGTNINLPSFTPTTAGELLYGFVINDTGTITAPTSGATLGVWTGSTVDSLGSASEYDLSASTATAANYTSSNSGATYDATIVGFAP